MRRLFGAILGAAILLTCWGVRTSADPDVSHPATSYTLDASTHSKCLMTTATLYLT